jgi:hypothetical protein
MLEYMDDVLGRLFDYVDSSPFKENSYVMVMSDNGSEMFLGELPKIKVRVCSSETCKGCRCSSSDWHRAGTRTAVAQHVAPKHVKPAADAAEGWLGLVLVLATPHLKRRVVCASCMGICPATEQPTAIARHSLLQYMCTAHVCHR